MTNMIEKYEDKIEILKHKFPMQIAWVTKILNVITQTENYKKWLERVKENGRLEFVPKRFKTPEMCRSAVEKFSGALKHVPDEIKTPEICRIAVENFSVALKSVPYKLKTLDLCEIAVKKMGRVLEYVPKELRTPEMCKIAMENDCRALEFVPEELKTKEMCRSAGGDPYLLKFVPEKFITRELVDMSEEIFSKDILKRCQPYKDAIKYLEKKEKIKQRKQAVKNTKPTNEADKGKVDLSEAKGRKTIRITFTYKPDEVTLNEIKKQGFRWYRSNWGAFYTEHWRAFYTEEKYNWANLFCLTLCRQNKFAGTTLDDIIVSDAGLGDDINSETEPLNDGAIDYNEIHDKLQREMKNKQKDKMTNMIEKYKDKIEILEHDFPMQIAWVKKILNVPNNENESTSSLKGVREYRDGLTPETVMKEFTWLLKAKFKYAVIGLDEDKELVWYDGTWEKGTWKKGTWKFGDWEDGIWEDGTWKNGTWFDGTWEDGSWGNGTWKNGTWKFGDWHYGSWFDGTWEDGRWHTGLWHEGTWKGGYWDNGKWESGTWKKGTWKNGTWDDGIWEDGLWEDGTWKKGTWKDGFWEYGTWENGNWLNGIWEKGTWEDGRWKGGSWWEGTWENGIWEKGTWESGTWESGTWKDGEWLGGIWLGGKWMRGDWKKGKIYDSESEKTINSEIPPKSMS